MSIVIYHCFLLDRLFPLVYHVYLGKQKKSRLSGETITIHSLFCIHTNQHLVFTGPTKEILFFKIQPQLEYEAHNIRNAIHFYHSISFLEITFFVRQLKIVEILS